MFGQKMTHALRSEMSQQADAAARIDALAAQNPGEVAARFSGDVDTVEALFTSGVISMAADVVPHHLDFRGHCRQEHRALRCCCCSCCRC